MSNPSAVAQSLFQSAYGRAPDLTVKAPGRVNLIGEHTDYNEGFVLPCALDLHTAVVAGHSPLRQGRTIRVVAADLAGQADEIDLDAPIVSNDRQPWSNYVRGVLHELRSAGHQLGSADLVFSGNLPTGAGLSSSSSLEVALGQALASLFKLPMQPLELAQLARAVENKFVGCQSGIMDPLIAVEGIAHHALLIDCRTYAHWAVRLPEKMLILIVDSRIERTLVQSHYNTRRAQCEEAARHFGVASLRELDEQGLKQGARGLAPVLMRRARHVISENQRTLDAAKALVANDISTLSTLMAGSHASMRDDFEITLPAIDGLVEIIAGVVGRSGGVRMTGGGFGGCVVALLQDESHLEQIYAAISSQYPRISDGRDARVFACRASNGARHV